MSNTGLTAAQQARQFLDGVLASSKGPLLPSIHALARRAGVSYVTMWKALREAEARGLVEGRRGAGYRIAGALPETREPASGERDRTPGWLRAKQEIQRRLVDGRFAAGAQLPSVKELQAGLGCSYRVVRKALESLCAERVLQQAGSRYRVPAVATPRSANRVMLALFGDAPMKPLPFSEGTRELFRLIERECSRRSLRLDVTTCIGGFPEGVRLFDKPTGRDVTISPDDDILGFLFLAIRALRCNVLLLNLLRQQCKPVAVVRDFGRDDDEFAQYSSGLVRMFELGRDRAPGRIVGRLLLELGHRRVAYIDDQPGQLWSQRRLEGLKEVYASHGLAGAVTAVTIASASEERPDSAVPEGHTGLTAHVRRAAEHLPFSAELSLQQVEATVETLSRSADLARRLAPHLDSLLAEPGITAWVGCNDVAALAAMDCLRQRGLAVVPSRLSVVGFDDSHAAFAADLTSYSFNMPGVATAMVDHVLQPPRMRARLREHQGTIEGFVVSRGSSARAWKPA